MTITRVPLVGPYNTRPGATLHSQKEKDRRFVNCSVMSIANELQREASPYVVKRPGFAVDHTPAPGELGTAIHLWVGQISLITAFGSTNSTIYTSNPSATVALGTITGKATAITETRVSDVPTLLITSTDNTGWFYDISLTQITDTEFPGNASVVLAGTFAPFAGYAFIMGTNGRLYNSDLNSVTSWKESNYFSTNSYPDNGIGCIRHRNTIVAFGVRTFEVFRNAGTPPPGSPLVRIDELTQQIGVLNALAILNVQDVIYFAGTTERGQVSIYAYDGGKAKPISNSAIDARLLVAGASSITLSAMSWYGVTYLIVQTDEETYAYGIDQSNPWCEIDSAAQYWSRADGNTSDDNSVSYSISTTEADGKVYVIDPRAPIYLDDGEPFVATVQTAERDEGTDRKKIFHSVAVIGDQEVTTSNLDINWTDDSYQNPNPDTRTIDLGSNDRTARRLGSARKRAWKLTHSANTPMRIQAIDIEFTVTSS